jgi:5,5'-dehydrodivanillate O-demethylase oxygenase subunit
VSIKIPIDDASTHKYVLYLDANPGNADRPIEHWVRQLHLEKQHTPDGRYRMDQIPFQDLAVMESQGTISPRETWRMAGSDRGLALYHRILLREVEKVERGQEPIGIVRDSADLDEASVLWAPKAHFRGSGIRVYPKDSATELAMAVPS